MKRRGSALIEFAAALMLLSSMFAGIFQFGYNFYIYNRLMNSVSAGARYASLSGSTDPESTRKVRNMVVYGDPKPSPDAAPLIPGLSPKHVDVTAGPDAITVSVKGFALDSMFAKIKLDGRPTVTFPSTTGASQ